MWHGLTIAWRMGCQNFIMNPILIAHPSSQSVLKVKHLLRKSWSVRIVHSMREGNRAIDFCANLGHSLDEGFLEFEYPSQGLQKIIQEDSYGEGFPRYCVSF